MRHDIRKAGYELLLDSLEEQLKELKRVRDLEIKLKEKSISPGELLELLEITTKHIKEIE